MLYDSPTLTKVVVLAQPAAPKWLFIWQSLFILYVYMPEVSQVCYRPLVNTSFSWLGQDVVLRNRLPWIPQIIQQQITMQLAWRYPGHWIGYSSWRICFARLRWYLPLQSSGAYWTCGSALGPPETPVPPLAASSVLEFRQLALKEWPAALMVRHLSMDLKYLRILRHIRWSKQTVAFSVGWQLPF